MKKILGLLGICSVIVSSAFIAGCGSNSNEGAPPAGGNPTPPADTSKPGSKTNPAATMGTPPPPPATK